MSPVNTGSGPAASHAATRAAVLPWAGINPSLSTVSPRSAPPGHMAGQPGKAPMICARRVSSGAWDHAFQASGQVPASQPWRVAVYSSPAASSTSRISDDAAETASTMSSKSPNSTSWPPATARTGRASDDARARTTQALRGKDRRLPGIRTPRRSIYSSASQSHIPTSGGIQSRASSRPWVARRNARLRVRVV